ncbi:hypothetical protein K504DRAFT_534948 [Pleomassaria siparia CBS 279.74]|uniref:Ubiquitin 3 binding protein But2 C-terminal domain-containing protein n=1 Tax=Pleomassaria siparia CBS 279.74 TaxID=1314801 RepID=A0A6G1K612_9PLEO|nr:hypothetical protein K504DRAFT_534948 [Pleomassaria siparia CBS 279.74]
MKKPTALSLSLYLVSTILPSPTTSLPTPQSPTITNTTSEHWLIPRLDMHYMMSERESGLPLGWPAWARFPSTMDFDINLPSGPWNCKASFDNGTLPIGNQACTRKSTNMTTNPDDTTSSYASFTMMQWLGLDGEGEKKRPEISYILSVEEHRIVGLDVDTLWKGNQFITANNPYEPTSYMTCIMGRPLDGERCQIKSFLSVREDLVLEAFEVSGLNLEDGGVESEE